MFNCTNCLSALILKIVLILKKLILKIVKNADCSQLHRMKE